jgi:2-C-methyl-D-erythritol 4-phosphate cytidylyltransferase
MEETLKSAKRYGCAIAAHKLSDSVKLSPKGFKATGTVNRNTAWVAETPQAFKAEVLEKILRSKGVKIVDDESEYVRKPGEVHMVEAGPLNMKIRTAEDLAIATALINAKVV